MESTATKNRQRVYLKSGMGSVAADDYDEKIHGKELKLTDEEYEARLRGVIPGTTPPTAAVAAGTHTTTIGGLQTFDPAATPAATPVTPAPPIAVAAPPVGKPVATVDQAEAKPGEQVKRPDAPRA